MQVTSIQSSLTSINNTFCSTIFRNIETTEFNEQQKTKNANYKILLVEDEPIVQKVHTRYLAKLGYQFELAENGKQALSMYSNKPDLILLDIGLPDMDGKQICGIIRQLEHQRGIKKRIPIIALTAYNLEEVQDCLSAGIDHIAQKPLKIMELNNILSYHLSSKLCNNTALI